VPTSVNKASSLYFIPISGVLTLAYRYFFPYYTGIFIFHVLKYIFHDLKYIFQGLKLKNLFEENRNAGRGCKKGIECP